MEDSKSIESQFLPKIGRHLAHELNNPISAIASAAYLIHDFMQTAEDGKLETESIRPFVDSIREECQRMKVIVEEFTRFVTTDSVLVMPIQIEDFIATRVREFQNNDIPVELHQHTSGSVIQGDLSQLQALLTNLVNYAKTSGATKIVLDTNVQNGALFLKLRDNRSARIAEDEKTTVFDALSPRKQRGLGLSLPLAKKIVDLHGGTIALTSNEENELHTEVTVCLPAAVPA